MRVVLPRETDSAVNLNVLRRTVEVRLGTERFRKARRDRQFIIALLRGPGRVVRRGLRRLDVEEHVRALVLDRLEGADRPTELHAVLRVFHGIVQHALSAADLFSGQCRGGHLQRRLETREGFAFDTDEHGRGVAEDDATLLARLVHGRERLTGHALRVALNGEERETLVGHGRHEDDRRRVAVGDVTAHAVHHEAVTDALAVVEVLARSQRPASSVSATVAIVSPEAIPGKYAALSSSVPTKSTAFAARATVEKYGEQKSAAPISSKTT